MSKPYLAPFKLGEELLIRRAPNGGYVVYQAAPSANIISPMLGAFGCAGEMLAALQFALTPESADQEDGGKA